MAEVLTSQLDYILFVIGVQLGVLHCISAVLWWGVRDRRVPWLWLALFGALRALSEWVQLTSGATGHGAILGPVSLLLRVCATLCLAQFGWAGIGPASGLSHYAPLLALPPLLVFAAAGQWVRVDGLCRFALNPLAGLAAAAAFHRAAGACTQTSLRGPLRLASAAVMLFGLVPIASSSTIALDPDLILNATPLQWARHALSGVIVAAWLGALYTYAQRLRSAAWRDLRVPSSTARDVVLWLVTIAAMVVGWLAVSAAGKGQETELRAALASRARSVSAGLDQSRIATLPRVAHDPEAEPVRWARHYLREIQAANPDCARVYLLQASGKRCVLLTGSGPGWSTAQRDSCGVRAGALGRLEREITITPPYHNSRGDWISAFAPVGVPGPQGDATFLGMDVNSDEWRQAVVRARLSAIATTLLLCLALSMVIVVVVSSEAAAVKSMQLRRGLHSVAEGSPNVITFLDTEGRLVSINKSGLERMGWQESDILGKRFVDMWPEQSRGIIDRALALVLQGKQCSFEADSVSASGTTIHWYVVLNPLPEELRETGRLTAIWTDLTGLREAEDAVRQQRDFLRTLLDTIPDPFFCKSREGIYIDCNKAYEDFLGLPRERVIGHSVDQVVTPPETAAIFKTQDNELLASPGVRNYETSVTRFDGSTRTVIINKATFTDGKGGIGGLLGTIVDITERKRVEDALALEKNRLAVTLRSIGDGVIATDTSGNVVLMNGVAESLTGWTEARAVGKPLPEVFRVVDGHSDKAPLNPAAEVLVTGEAMEFAGHSRLVSLDGTDRVIASNCAPIRDRGDHLVGAVLVFKDITAHRQAEEAVRQNEKRFHSLFTAMNEGCAIHEIVYGPDGEPVDYVFVAINERCESIIGCPQDEVIGRPVSEVFGTGEAPFLDTYAQVAATGRPCCFETDFKPLHKQFRISAFSPAPGTFATVFEDITDRKRAEEAVRTQISAMNAATDQIVIASITDGIVFANSAFLQETGHTLDEVAGRDVTAWLGAEDRLSVDVIGSIWDTALTGSTWHGEVEGRTSDGGICIADVTVTPVRNSTGVVEHVIAIKRDITDKKVYEEKLDHLAHHDPLTGLPNRLLFSDRLNQSLAHARRGDRNVAVMFMDLDRFKLINDTMGHNAGDVLLWQAAGRLTKRLRGVDTIARMGGDEFTVILSDIDSPDDAVGVAERILALFSEPFVLAGKEMFISTSIGISVFPTDGQDVETLVRNADSAMYRAKEQGKNSYSLYTESLNAEAMEQINLLNNIRKALQKNEFLVYYQPKIDIHTGEVLGTEALIRWQHPEMGFIPPSHFIPLAEETGLIGPISNWVLRTACAQNKAWQDAGLPPMAVAVNISARQLEQSDLVTTVKEVLRDTGLDPALLDLEVTESMLMRSPELSAQILHELKSMGVRISIDDFGTGHSSLSKIKRLPIDTVKIDQSFVKDITTNADDAAISAAVVAMAHSMNLNVVAEGVETLEQLEFLRSLQCDEVQGYFVSRPVPPNELVEVIRESHQTRRRQSRKAA